MPAASSASIYGRRTGEGVPEKPASQRRRRTEPRAVGESLGRVKRPAAAPPTAHAGRQRRPGARRR